MSLDVQGNPTILVSKCEKKGVPESEAFRLDTRE